MNPHTNRVGASGAIWSSFLQFGDEKSRHFVAEERKGTFVVRVLLCLLRFQSNPRKKTGPGNRHDEQFPVFKFLPSPFSFLLRKRQERGKEEDSVQ